MKRLIGIVFACILCLCIKAQDTTFVSVDTESHAIIIDSVKPERNATSRRLKLEAIPEEPIVLTHRDSVRLYFKPDAMRAVWMGAIIPGYGQIYNRSYWKLPVVYGAFFGCAYAITWTNGMYQDYKTAYRDILTADVVTNDPSNSYIAILPEGYTLERVGGASQWTTTLKNRQNNYRRYRDLSIVASVLVYALSLVDAYVDAQLFDYDISPDLSMSIDPGLYQDFNGNKTAELHLAIRF